MQSFDIIKNSTVQNSFRVAKIMSDFDVKAEHATEHFVGKIDMPEKWQIGCIVGNSGTGKSTIAKELFPENYIKEFKYYANSVIDDMPKSAKVEEITKTFYSVGFGSVPSWLKPYSVLSNGEKARVDLARALLEKDFIVFDEFTSVIDRTVAQTACLAIKKALKRTNKQFIAVSCHFDILEWLEPDWIFNTNTMQMDFQLAHTPKNNLKSGDVGEVNGLNLGVIII